MTLVLEVGDDGTTAATGAEAAGRSEFTEICAEPQPAVGDPGPDERVEARFVDRQPRQPQVLHFGPTAVDATRPTAR